MVKKIFLFFLAILPLAISAQSVQVKKEKARVDGENSSGYQVALMAPEEEVKNSLSKYLKALGKTKISGDYITMAEPVIGGKKYTTSLYATTKQNGNATTAWFGVPSGTGEESSLDGDLQNMVHDFGVTFHREKIQMQVDESLRALQTVEKQQIRLVNQHKDLISKIESNKREKVHLEKLLVENKLELEDLTKKLEANAKAQDSVAIANVQIKKVVEMHKEKQQKVE